MLPSAKLQHEGQPHARWFEDRDPHGCVIHWQWLLKHWEVLADKILAEEQRRQR